MPKPYKRKDSRFWWIAPMIDGVQRPQSSETTDYYEALDTLHKLQGQIAQGVPITPRAGRAKFKEIAADLQTNYKIKGRHSKADLDRRLDKHLLPFFGQYKLSKITPTLVTDYIVERQEAGAANATINRELAILKRAFTLAMRSGKAVFRPYIEMLPEDNVREGFFEDGHFKAVLRKATRFWLPF